MKNNKGFVLIETLIVSVFVMFLFTIIYTNFYPLIGVYEKLENYDTVEGTFNAYNMKKGIEGVTTSTKTMIRNTVNTSGYYQIVSTPTTASNYYKKILADKHKKMWDQINIQTIIITSYKTTNLKNKIGNFSSDIHLQDYIENLATFDPNVSPPKNSNCEYRLILEYTFDGTQTMENGTDKTKKYYYFSTYELDLS